MTIRLPGNPPATRPGRRARYALAALPLLLAPHASGSIAQVMPRASEDGSASGGQRSPGEPTGIREPTPAPPTPQADMSPAPAQPQPAPQPALAVPGAAAAADPGIPAPDQDPPARVGRVARMVGQVSYRAPGQDAWTPARMNLTVTDGTAVYTQPNARAAIEVNGSRIALDPGSDLQVTRLTEQGLQATLPQGSAFFRMRGMLPGETAEIVTPRGAFTMQENGRYLVEAGDEQRPTRLTAFEGTATARGEGFQTPVPPGQTLVLSGVGAPQGAWVRAQPNALTAWAASMDGRAPMPAAVQQMTGAEAMLPYGRWDRNAQYGDIWYPTQVQQGWAPYRNGQWVWRDPWGWTWVDDQPWGYAPSHYGRWVNEGGRWGWVPQVVTAYDPGYAPPPRPYWAPALVSFIAGAAVGAMVAPVAWVPLAPHEPFLPWWRASPRYVGYVNTPHVRNIAVVNNYWASNVWRGPAPSIGTPRPPIPGFGPPLHLRAATVVPGSVFTSGQRVLPAARPLPPGFAQAPGTVAPVFGTAPVRPVAQTPGLTPDDARRMGLPVVPPAQRAPGPPPAQHAALLGAPPVSTPGGQPPLPNPGAGRPGFGAAAVGAGVAAGAAAGIAAGVAGSRPGSGAAVAPPLQPVPPPGLRPGAAVAPAPGLPAPGGKPPGAQPGSSVPSPVASPGVPGARPQLPGSQPPVGQAPGLRPGPSAPMPAMQPVPGPRPTPPPTGAFQPPPQQRFNPPPPQRGPSPPGGFGGASAPPPRAVPPPMPQPAPAVQRPPPPSFAAPPPRPAAPPPPPPPRPAAPPPPPPPRPASPPPQQRPQGLTPR